MSEETLLGERIAKARQAKGLSPRQLAQRLGIKKTTLLNWESERSAPRANRINQLAGVLDVPLLWLIAGAEVPAAIATPDLNETTAIEAKLRRAENLVNELSALLVDIRAQTRRVQREMDVEVEE
ncbi:MAG: XRE family transcriptional regulator [Proteobacteria bacterium]|nr:MAG: XRE family transcriptional regulator [Pseudomonadota bacterium]